MTSGRQVVVRIYAHFLAAGFPEALESLDSSLHASGTAP